MTYSRMMKRGVLAGLAALALLCITTPSPTSNTKKVAPQNSKPTPIKTTISCVKGKTIKKVTAINPKCPTGYKKK